MSCYCRVEVSLIDRLGNPYVAPSRLHLRDAAPSAFSRWPAPQKKAVDVRLEAFGRDMFDEPDVLLAGLFVSPIAL